MTSINKLILSRRSTVTFAEKNIEPVKLKILFEAASWAPSSFNQQPWRFIYATKDNPKEYNILFECLTESNKEWAKHAPVLALSIAEVVSPHNNKDNYYAFYDTGMAVGNLLIQATEMNLYVHQMGGYDKEKAKTLLKIPAGYEPVAMIAIGYMGNIYELPDDLRKRESEERKRNPLSSFVFNGQWEIIPDF